MTNTIIRPTFAIEADRLLFLSRLWQVTLTVQDTLDWQAYKLTEPTIKLPTESESEYSERQRVWNENRVLRYSHYILSKWDGYGLGKVKELAEAYLATRPAPNRTQSREAVRLQLEAKWTERLIGLNVSTDLLALIEGLEW